ncbi:MAG: phosphodiesterase [Paracoccaceae bacterium]
MTKLIWMSDLHFLAGDRLVAGHDPKVRLQAAVDHIRQHYQDADFCVISGDLVNEGNADDYRALEQQLAGLGIDYLLMVGNHDDRAQLAQVFPRPKGAMPDHWQYYRQVDGGLYVFLDTLKPGSGAGEFCAERMGWLQDLLSANSQMPTYIFMHHPPMPLGLPRQDEIMLEQGGEFLELIAMHPQLKHLFIGHVHRPVTGVINGVPYATMRSVLYQAPPPRPDWDWEGFAPAQEAPAYGVLQIKGGDVTVQYTQFCAYEFGVSTGA